MSVSSLSFTDPEDSDTLSELPVSSLGTPSLTGATTSKDNMPRSPADSPALRKHDRFYFEDGTITFVVQGVLYCVHRYFFRRDSSYFADILKRIQPSENADSATQITLEDVDCSQFDALLSVLYPTFDESELQTVDAWTSVLHLSTKWSFSSIRRLAIKRLQPIASAIDKVVLGRTYGIDAWLLPGFVDLCDRAHPLTVDEGFRLGVADIILITTVREGMRIKRRYYSRNELEGLVESRLEPRYVKGAAGKANDEDTGKRKDDGDDQGTWRAYDEAMEDGAMRLKTDVHEMTSEEYEAALRRAAKEEGLYGEAQEDAVKGGAHDENVKTDEEAGARKPQEEDAAMRSADEQIAVKNANSEAKLDEVMSVSTTFWGKPTTAIEVPSPRVAPELAKQSVGNPSPTDSGEKPPAIATPAPSAPARSWAWAESLPIRRSAVSTIPVTEGAPSSFEPSRAQHEDGVEGNARSAASAVMCEQTRLDDTESGMKGGKTLTAAQKKMLRKEAMRVKKKASWGDQPLGL